MFGRRELEKYIHSCKKPPGSQQMIDITFDLGKFDTDLERKMVIIEIEKYIRNYLQWDDFDVKLYDLESKETIFNKKNNYLEEFVKLDFMNFMLIRYKRTGQYEIELDAMTPEEVGDRQVFPQGVPSAHKQPTTFKRKKKKNEDKNKSENLASIWKGDISKMVEIMDKVADDGYLIKSGMGKYKLVNENKRKLAVFAYILWDKNWLTVHWSNTAKIFFNVFGLEYTTERAKPFQQGETIKYLELHKDSFSLIPQNKLPQ